MISLSSTDKANQYGTVSVIIKQPWTVFSNNGAKDNDLDRQNRGKRWEVGMTASFFEKTDNPAGAGDEWAAATKLMRCAVCFDVKKEDAELKEGHKGIGYCYQKIDTTTYWDGNFFGTVEAQGSDSFRFADDTKNDWDIDSGYL